MSKTALASAIGVNMTTIGRWEDEDDLALPTVDRAVQLAEVLNVSLEELVYGQPTVFERALAQARREFQDQIQLLREELLAERGEPPPPSARRAESPRRRG